LFDLRKITAEHPYYQPARILLLKNLFLLHDPTFDDELRRAAIFLTDRTVLFDLVEASHYGVKNKQSNEDFQEGSEDSNRTASLIENSSTTFRQTAIMVARPRLLQRLMQKMTI
jgi:hypothetical protein